MVPLCDRPANRTANTHLNLLATACVLLASLLTLPGIAAAQLTTADWIDWDLPSLEAGTCPAAIGALTRRPPTGEPIDPLYYVTRCEGADGASLVQFIPGNEAVTNGNMAVDAAQWTAWPLGVDPGSPAGVVDFSPTGGMRLSTIGMAFIRGATRLLRLNLLTNTLTTFNDVVVTGSAPDPNAVSDVAIVERSGGYVDVWTTHDTTLVGPADNPLVPVDPLLPPGIVQRLTVSNTSNNATVTRWAVDGEAGRVYLSGIAVFQGKVYFSEASPFTLDPLHKRGNSIGVLDPTTSKVKRYSLDDAGLPGVSGPKQLTVDSTGTVWVLTESGHLVSLKVRSNGQGDMAAYMIPSGPTSLPISLSPNGARIGFTEGGLDQVGLLNPNKAPVTVDAGLEETVARVTTSLTGTTATKTPVAGSSLPLLTQGAAATHTDIDPFGDFTEASITQSGGAAPIGILRDWDPDTFWVTQLGGSEIHRLTRISFAGASIQFTSGKVTGGGTIDATNPNSPLDSSDEDAWAADGGKANFGLNVYKKAPSGTIRGNLNYVNKVTGEHVKSVQILTFEIFANNTARFTGTCTNNGVSCTFDVTVQDNGNPGKGHDTFSISGSGIVANSGTLNGGNIKIHKTQ